MTEIIKILEKKELDLINCNFDLITVVPKDSFDEVAEKIQKYIDDNYVSKYVHNKFITAHINEIRIIKNGCYKDLND